MTEKEITERHARAGNAIVNGLYTLIAPWIELGENLYTMFQMNREMRQLKFKEQQELESKKKQDEAAESGLKVVSEQKAD